MLDGMRDGRLGNFVEDNAAGLFGREPQDFGQMPGNGFSFPVFIGSEPDRLGLAGRRGELGHRLLLVG